MGHHNDQSAEAGQEMKWRESSWYPMCSLHLDRYRKEGGYCKANPKDKFKCAFCQKRATYEFYPVLRKKK